MNNFIPYNEAQITILTRVHNPGEYIYRCVDSVLNQTFPFFKFVIIDNASSDGTKEVLESYAKKDSRISLLRNESNDVTMLFCLNHYVETKYFMVLDHDDWLESDALAHLLSFAEQDEADIVFGRTNVMTEREQWLETRGYDKSFIGSPTEMAQILPALYWQLRTTWAALIHHSLIQHIDVDTFNFRLPSKYAGDTVLMLSMAFSAKRIGFTRQVIHNYRFHTDSESNTFCKERFLADWVLFDMAKNLLEKMNGLTNQNLYFLYRVYCHAICDTATVAIRSKQSLTTTIDVLEEILKHLHTREMIPFVNQIELCMNRLLDTFGTNIFSIFIKNADNPSCQTLLFDWLDVLYGALNLSHSDYRLLVSLPGTLHDLCLNNPNSVYNVLWNKETPPDVYAKIQLAFLLHCEKDVKILAARLLIINEYIPNLIEDIQPIIILLASQNRLVKDIQNLDYCLYYKIILQICISDYKNALTECLNLLQAETTADIYPALQIALRLSAILKDSSLFLELKIIECEYLILNQKPNEATIVLNDLLDMCPNDTTVLELKKQLSNL